MWFGVGAVAADTAPGRLQTILARLAGPSALLAIALLLGRLSGLAREILLAARFGVSAEADMAVLVLSLPDLLANLLLAGGLSAALVPRFRSLDPAGGAALFRSMALACTALFLLLAAVLVVAPGLLFGLLAPGMSVGPMLGAGTLVLLALALPATAMSGVASAYLNANGRYFLVGCGTLIVNAVIIAALAIAPGGEGGLRLLAAGIAAGASLRLASQLLQLPRGSLGGGALARIDRRLARDFGFGLVATGLAIAVPFAVRAAASFLAPGAIAAFNYAQKLVELPLGILLTAIGTVALTRLSGHVAAGDRAAADRDAHDAARLAIGLALVIALFGWIFMGPFVRVALGRGEMSADDLARVARLAAIGFASVPFAALANVATAWLTARGELSRVLGGTAIALAVAAAVAALGVGLASEAMLMLATVAFQLVLALLLAARAGMRPFGPAALLGWPLLRALAVPLVAAGGAFLIAAVPGLSDTLLVAIGAFGVVFAAAFAYVALK